VEEPRYVETENEADRRLGRWQAPDRILAVLASPRGSKGATGLVYARLAAGMARAGATVETVSLAELDPKPCSGCFRCWIRGGRRCVLPDRMTEFGETVPGYGLLVLVTPLYVDGMTGLAKNFIDRLMTLDHPSIVKKDGRYLHPCRHPRMPDLALLSVCALPGPENFRPLVDHVQAIGRHMHAPLAAAILRPEALSFRHPEAKPRLEDALSATEHAGESLIRTGAVPGPLLERIQAPLLSEEAYVENAEGWWTD
jgi:hypothetical protein